MANFLLLFVSQAKYFLVRLSHLLCSLLRNAVVTSMGKSTESQSLAQGSQTLAKGVFLDMESLLFR